MSDTFRNESRREWRASGIGVQPSDHQLIFGCLQRIADASELMAKNWQGLIDERDQARRSRDYWQERAERVARSNNALRGLVTKLKKARTA